MAPTNPTSGDDSKLGLVEENLSSGGSLVLHTPQRPQSAGPLGIGHAYRGRLRRHGANGQSAYAPHRAPSASAKRQQSPQRLVISDIACPGADCSFSTLKRGDSRPSSTSLRRGGGVAAGTQLAVAAAKEAKEGTGGNGAISALMYAVMQVYEHRTHADVWTKLLEPLRALVPCESAKVVVRTIGSPTKEKIHTNYCDPDVQWRLRTVNYVEHWNPQRIEGQAALTQRICRIPSQEAIRQNWDQYEVGRSNAVGTGGTDALRCLVAVPFFDASGNILAVVKLINRRLPPDGSPSVEFLRSDLTTLSAFSAIFACIIPFPYLMIPGASVQRRPQARIQLSDREIGAQLSWQLPRDLCGGPLFHEVLYAEMFHEDEYSGQPPSENDWHCLPCGLLTPAFSSDDEGRFEFAVPNLEPDTAYIFRARVRNMHTCLDWSEPSVKLSTFLVPPHSVGSESISLTPLSDCAVQLEWRPFMTCDPGFSLIEYRVVARTFVRDSLVHSESVEQVCTMFISDSAKEDREVAKIMNLQSTLTYVFYVEARYPFVGSRDFTRVIESDQFCFPTVDITLPAPQPFVAEPNALALPKLSAQSEHPVPVLIRWPYPTDLSHQLILQYRVASVASVTKASAEGRGGQSASMFPRLNHTVWTAIRPADIMEAQLVREDVASEVRIIREVNLQDQMAVQLRVIVMPGGSHASPPSAWFHPQPPAAPDSGSTKLICSDREGIALQVAWYARGDKFLLSETHEGSSRELGPVGYSVRHDFQRGNGPCPTRFQVRLRVVSADGDPRGDWQEQIPQLLPPPCNSAGHRCAPDGTPLSCHRHLLQESCWVAQPGVTWEVEVRHGNALFWSGWAHSGMAQIRVAPPAPAAGSKLEVDDIRTDSARVSWQSFVPAENRLQALEYRILCLELPDSSDSRPDVGGRIVAWRTVDTLIGDADQAALGASATFTYVVRSLLPSRRYQFALECRYLGLPSAVSSAAVSRIEGETLVPSREAQLTILPAGASAERVVAHRLCADQQRPQAWGFSLNLDWRFGIQPACAPVARVYCYQLCCEPCIPKHRGSTVAKVFLPPAMLTEKSRADGPAVFLFDRACEAISANVQLCASCIDSNVARFPLKLSVRVGDPATGGWSCWHQLADPIMLALTPAAPQPGDLLAIKDELWDLRAGAPPINTAHAVQSLALAWAPFRPANSTPWEQHTQLILEYEITCWCLDADSPFEDDIRHILQASDEGAARKYDTRIAFRHQVRPDLVETEAGCVHKYAVPVDCLLPHKNYYFRITSRYLFASGTPVPEPLIEYEPARALVSREAYSPTPHLIPAPSIVPFPSPYDEAADCCVVLQLPQLDRSFVDAGPFTIEHRQGRVCAGGAELETTIAASNDWEVMSSYNTEVLPGGLKLVLHNLEASIYQFRVHRGRLMSEPSSWLDTSVWCPAVEVQHGGRHQLGHTGLSLALGVTPDISLYARLIWPRSPPQLGATRLQRYQVRHRVSREGEPWHTLAAVDLPPPSDAGVTIECPVSGLEQGACYQFSLRLCNALKRWSGWTVPTTPLRMELPAPAPSRGAEQGGVRLAMVTATAVKLVWRPFSIPCRDEDPELPLLLEEADECRGSLPAEYELAIKESDGAVVSIIQREAVTLLDEVPIESEAPWLEAEVPLEAHKAYGFAIRARLRCGIWGPPLVSPPLPPRLQPIALGTPLVDLLLQNTAEGKLEAALRFECATRGFKGCFTGRSGAAEQTMEADRKSGALVQCQLRSRLVVDAPSSPRQLEEQEDSSAVSDGWSEWAPMPAGSAHSPGEHLVQFEVPVHYASTGGAANLGGQPLLPAGGDYVFCLRCMDEFGRWTRWSSPTEAQPVHAPVLGFSQPERTEGGANLRIVPAGSTAVVLEWAQFRPRWPGAAVQRGLEPAIQRVAYRIRMIKRLGSGTDDWTSVPVAEIVSDRRDATHLSHKVVDLDERFEYVFHLSGRWVDMPPVLGAQDWTSEVSSLLLPQRLQELSAPKAPCLDVQASESEGLCFQVLWPRSIVMPTKPGSWYQLRFADVSRSSSISWKVRPPVVSDDVSEASNHEVAASLHGMQAGRTYRVSVRVGDAHRWSPWSEPSTQVTLCLPPPIPSSRDVLEVAFVAEVDSLRLEWRPFRGAEGLSRIEYKIMALEWPSVEGAKDTDGGPLLTRLRQVAQEASDCNGGGVGQHLRGHRSFRAVGYVTRHCPAGSGAPLRGQGERVEWRTDGLRPGMHYRFFVCARYGALPAGALAAPPGLPPDTALDPYWAAWPDEHCETLRADTVAWEATLSRFGLWSDVVNTLHLPPYAVRPVSALTSALGHTGGRDLAHTPAPTSGEERSQPGNRSPASPAPNQRHASSSPGLPVYERWMGMSPLLGSEGATSGHERGAAEEPPVDGMLRRVSGASSWAETVGQMQWGGIAPR